MRRSAVLSVLTLSLVCQPAFAQWPGSSTVPRTDASAAVASPAAPASAAASAIPAGIAAPAAAQSATPGHQVVDIPEMSFLIPSAWASEPPAGTMRKAQIKIPHGAGDTDDGQIAVFYFGAGGGGGVEANIARWYGQIDRPDGKPVDQAAKRDTLTSGTLKITIVDVTGTLKASSMPGMPEHEAKPNSRLLSAIVETAEGPWFFKGTGPDKTMAAARDEFQAMLQSIKVK